MTDENLAEDEKYHRKFAIELFNYTWTLLEKENRDKDDDLDMINAAHASRFHWGKIGNPINFERGDWQISRVYAILDKSEQALIYANKCLEICQKNNIGDFDLAFAYEALARAYAIAGNQRKFKENLKLAEQAANNIKKADDKEYFLKELKTIKI